MKPRDKKGDKDVAEKIPQSAVLLAQAQQFMQTGQLEKAAEVLHLAMQQREAAVQACYLLGCVFFLQERYSEALGCFDAVLREKTENPIFLNNKAVTLEKLGQDKAAETFYRQAMQIKIDYLEPFYNLAALLEKNGEYMKAIQGLLQFEAKQKGAKFYNLLGRCYEKLNGFDHALQCYRKALDEEPNSMEAANHLGSLLTYRGKMNEACQILEKMLEQYSTDVALLNNIGQTYLLMGEADKARSYYQQAIAHNKEDTTVFASNYLLTLNYLPMYPQHIFAEHQKWGAQFTAQQFVFSNDRDKKRPLRIGYVSPDFYSHSVMYFFEPVLRHHNHQAVEVTLYSGHPYLHDETTERLRSMTDHWRDISRLSHEEAKALIKEDGIDILVDLTGHAAKNRLPLFALKPAPIQVTWIGYPNTTGLSQMDYRFTDAFADPVGVADDWHTEKLFRLPQTFLCYQPRSDVEEVGALPAEKTGFVTFASFNNLSKINPELIVLWSKILQRVPNSRLLMKARGLGDITVQRHYAELFAAQGISANQVVFAERSATLNEHFHYYNEVDILLDTFPYHGTTTTCDSLWMGVPVITMAGGSHVSRVGVSLLRNAGLSELIAANPAQYVEFAIYLAADIKRMTKLRIELRDTMKKSPLLDGMAMAKHVETAYRTMWETWVSGLSEDSSAVAEQMVQQIPKGENLQMVEVERHYQAAASLKDQERWQEAVQEYQTVVSLLPQHAEAHASLAAILYVLGNQEAAYKHYQMALSLNPQNYALLHNYAIFLKNSGKSQEAVRFLEKAIELKPDYLSALYHLLVIYQERGDWEQVLAWAQRVLAVDPNHADALKIVGMIYKGRGQRQQAEVYLKKALAIRPNAVEILNTLGNLYTESGNIQEAIAFFTKALNINPNEAITYCNLAGCLAKQGKSAETLAYFRKALQLKPDMPKLHSNILLALAYLEDANPQYIYEEHQKWAADHAANLYPENLLPVCQSKSQTSKARRKIGYLSPDFRNHAVSFFIEPVLRECNKDKFEIVLYSDVKFPDEATKRISGEVEHWRDISRMSDEQVYQLICQDGIDILVDLAGHTADNRMLIFARKPAPIQVTWIGYPNTTGLATMDYRFTDHYADPVGLTEKLHSEKLIRLKHSFLCYCPKANSPEVGELPYLKNGFITFGSFNNFNKVSAKTTALWAKILTHIPRSRLLIKSGGFSDSYVKEKTLATFAELGIAPERIIMLGQIPSYYEHLAKYNEIDIALDTFPYHGTTTTCEALWMGVPVITLAGTTHVSRVGVSLLSNVGLDGCIAVSPEEYEEFATNLAADIERLRKLRSNLRKNMLASPLMEVKQFVSDLENTYDQLWQRYQTVFSSEADIKNSAILTVEEDLARAAQKRKEGDLATAEYFYKKALSTDADNITALHDFALLLAQLGRDEEGIQLLTHAVSIATDSFAVVYNLALLYQKNNDIAQALSLFTQAQRIRPQHLGASVNLARSYKEIGKVQQSVYYYQMALNLSPNNVDIINELANMLSLCGKGTQAISLLQQGLDKEPGRADLMQSLGFSYKINGDADKALEYYRAAVAIDPSLVDTYSNILSTLNCLPGYDKTAVFQEHKMWAQCYADSLPQNLTEKNAKEMNWPLRIGYVSGDFRQHSVAYFFEAVLKNYDRTKTTVYLYSNSKIVDDTSRSFAKLADKWTNIYGVNDEEAAQIIAHDGIDILVDLAGHTEGNRLLVFARRPAPVQVTWLGYPNTTGLQAMDYRITDEYADPASAGEAFYAEKLIRMDKCFLCYSPKVRAPEISFVPQQNNKGIITFGSFNSLHKITPQVISLWARILNAVPQSRLLLKSIGLADQAVQEAMQQKFFKQGISKERIILYGHKETHSSHMDMYKSVDIALDTFPYNGTTTTCEALWMGVPVVTLVGDSHVSRVGVSLLHNAGLPELAVEDEEEYVKMAAMLATIPEHLQILRQKLRLKMEKSPLLEGRQFTRELEGKYYSMWDKWIKSKNENV